MLPAIHTSHLALGFRVGYHASVPLHHLHFQRDLALARLLSALFFYSACFLSLFYSWCHVLSSSHSEPRSQLHSASIHRLFHRRKGSIPVTQQLATAGSCQSILNLYVPTSPGECVFYARACSGSLEMTSQKPLKMKHTLQLNSTLMCGICPCMTCFRIHFW